MSCSPSLGQQRLCPHSSCPAFWFMMLFITFLLLLLCYPLCSVCFPSFSILCPAPLGSWGCGDPVGIVSRWLFRLLINEVFTDASAAELCGLPSVLDCEMLLRYFLRAPTPKGGHTELFLHLEILLGKMHTSHKVCVEVGELFVAVGSLCPPCDFQGSDRHQNGSHCLYYCAISLDLT